MYDTISFDSSCLEFLEGFEYFSSVCVCVLKFRKTHLYVRNYWADQAEISYAFKEDAAFSLILKLTPS